MRQASVAENNDEHSYHCYTGKLFAKSGSALPAVKILESYQTLHIVLPTKR